jgi:hypothetical protein
VCTGAFAAFEHVLVDTRTRHVPDAIARRFIAKECATVVTFTRAFSTFDVASLPLLRYDDARTH